jgi:hypothetical protein
MGILVHQSDYVQKILEKFNMDKDYPPKTPMVIRDLEKETDPFGHAKKRYWALNTHTLVPLEHCSILPTIQDPIFLLQLICMQDIMQLLP